MRDGEESRDAIDRRPEIIATAFVRGTDVNGSAHAKAADVVEVFLRKSDLRSKRSRYRIFRKTYPPCSTIAARISSSCRRTAACLAARPRSQRSVLPSMSVKTKVTAPVGIDSGSRSRGVALTIGRFARGLRLPVLG
jgi:hypothetical protein